MRFISQILSSIDWFLMIPLIILILISLSTLFSIDPALFESQLIFLLFSIVVFLVFSQINPNVLRHYALPIYIISIVLLVIVLILGIESRGSVRWVEILGVRIQFSEVLKPFLAISLATFLSEKRGSSLSSYFFTLALLFPVFFLVFLQPDLGNAIIYGGVVVLSLLTFGFPLRYFISSAILFVFSLPLFWLSLHDYQKSRVMVFLDPSSDPLGKSYNAIQAVIAVGSGAIIGKGLGQGTQSALKFLPEHHTDFIFATISEDFGFIGSLIVVLSFAFLLYRIFIIHQNGEDLFSKTFTIIAFFIIFVHFVINIGMNVGLLPVVGVTLPFMSSGGSSLLSNFILLGLLFAVNRSSKSRSVLEIR